MAQDLTGLLRRGKRHRRSRSLKRSHSTQQWPQRLDRQLYSHRNWGATGSLEQDLTGLLRSAKSHRRWWSSIRSHTSQQRSQRSNRQLYSHRNWGRRLWMRCWALRKGGLDGLRCWRSHHTRYARGMKMTAGTITPVPHLSEGWTWVRYS